MSTRLCSACNRIFDSKQVLNEEQPHHQSPDEFLAAAQTGCYVCRTITTSPDWPLVASQESVNAVWYLSRPAGSPEGFYRLTIDTLGGGEGGGEEEEVGETEPQGEFSDDNEEDGLGEGEPDIVPAAWGFHLQQASDLRDCVGDYVPPAGLDDPKIAQLAQKWFEECCRGHLCGPRDPTFRPTRLVEILDESTVRIVLTQEKPDVSAYAAFSHCWGKTPALKLLRGNVSQLCAGISVEDLPTSYQEAISMCLILGLRYIWIDSICITQDDGADWRREAATMKDVYRNSSLNICTCAAAESSQCSFGSRDCSMIKPMEVVPKWHAPEQRRYYLSDAEIYQKGVEDSPLRTRAWVLQEVWLSRRSLSLTKSQLWWECQQRRACESFPGGLPSTWLSQDLAKDLTFHRTRSQHGEITQVRSLVELRRSWAKLVELYSRCGLTVMLDKMMAFSGVAEVFKQTESPDDVYVAGLWRRMLPEGLYWSTTKLDRTRRPDVYRAPSWSWGSIEGAVGFPPDLEREGSDVTPLCEVVDVNIRLVDEGHETGLLRGAAMVLRGKLLGPVSTEAPEYTLKTVSGVDRELDEALQAARWGFDETTDEGGDALSYLDGFKPEQCRQGELDGFIRRTMAWDQNLPVRLFCLPVFESFHGDGLSIRGLVLCRVDHQPEGVYHRVGDFSHMPMVRDVLAGIATREIVLL